jgi:DNA-binding NarL/FixJ family response regulator
MEKITILITDDHTLVRQSWAMLINSDPRFQVVAECGSGEEAIEVAKKIRPDVVLMDINLTGISGFEATTLLRKYSPGSRILAVSLHTLPVYARKMIQAGAMGYITKNSSHEEMAIAIVEIYNGRKYICREIKETLSRQAIMDKDEPRGLDGISKRELDIIGYLKKGLSSKEIAQSINLSVKTVEVHRYNILKKLGLPNVASLVNYVNNCQLTMAD